MIIPNMSPTILLFGCGNIGLRHFQSIIDLKYISNCYVIEKDLDRENEIKKKFKKEINKHKNKINFLNSINKVKTNFVDIIIVATNADVRYKVALQLIRKFSFNHMILEKVLFQKINDYIYFKKKINNLESKIWVNCNRRTAPYFQKLKKKIKNNLSKMEIIGSNWNLASNSIHFIDLFAYLISDTNLNININNLHKKTYVSKDSNYYELGGKIIINSNHDNLLILIDSKNKNNKKKVELNITFDKKKLKILEYNGLVYINSSNLEKNKSSTEIYKMPLQSILTKKLIKDLMLNDTCDLPTFHDSAKLHLIMIKKFNEFFNSIKINKSNICKIT